MNPRIIFVSILLLAAVGPSRSNAEGGRAAIPEEYVGTLQDYCFECHDAFTTKGGVNLEDLTLELDTIQAAESWQKVLNVMNSGEMPPADETQLTSDEKTAFLDELSHQLVTARELLCDTGGVITMRRLNRREYENTIYDLLGVRINATLLPDDTHSDGFDTTGASLFFSSDQFEQYLTLAHKALDEAFVFGKKPKPLSEKRESETNANVRFAKLASKLKGDYERAQQWRATDGTEDPKDFGFIDESDVRFHERLYNQQYATYRQYLDRPESERGLILYRLFSGAVVDSISVPAKWPPGRYVLTVRAATLPDANPSECFLEHGRTDTGGRSGEMEVLGCNRVTGTMEHPQDLQIPIIVTKDGSRSFALRQRQPNSRDATRSAFLQSQVKTGTGPPPSLWIDWVAIDGPMFDVWPPTSVSKVFFRGMWWQQPDEDRYAREIIEQFARRAFRIKEPSASFLERLFDSYADARAEGQTFSQAIRQPLVIVMASPSFLYQLEPVAGAAKRELSAEELAVRLSYFLWSAPPDDELYAEAVSGDLKTPARLQWHTNRMLDESKSAEFIASFAHQWLHMERLDFFQFDFRQFPEFDESVKQAARREVYETIRSILVERRSLSDLLMADHVVVNDVLANYYGIEGVQGSDFRKIALGPDSPRGGLLGMAAVHAMGSDGNRSSPVERGAWVMRKLLHDPPPPAPANVPQLSRVQGKLLAPREQLAAHMEEAQCAQCHRKIDPIGHGLDNFDAAGKWRDTLVLNKVVNRKVKQTKEIPIDASGQLPDGTPFIDYFQLRDKVAENDDAFARGFAEALIEYALGRPYGFSDESLREQMIIRANSKDGQMREFIHALVQSKPFRTKK